MKVLIAFHIGEGFLEDLRGTFPQVEFRSAMTVEQQLREVVDADVFFGMPKGEVLLAAKRLRWLHCPGTGIDQIASIPQLVNSDVVVTNARGAHADAMADHVLGMMLYLAHHFGELIEDKKAHRWDTKKYDRRMVELKGRTMGILALGDIGRAVARRAHATGMTIYAVDIRPLPPSSEVKEVWEPQRLDDLLRIADWFVVTAPLTSKTRGLIDRRRIGLMKQGAYIIVISRGGIIDESALLEALRSGHLAGAGLDVFNQEPLPPDSPFWDLDNVIISPHASALSSQMWERRRQIFKENLHRFLNNQPFLYVCNKEAGF
jgi:phosphoglycerate dehydrogenase-like enzyme